MISAGVRNNADGSLVFWQGGNLVVCSAQFEGADRLLAFELQIKFAVAVGDELGPRNNAAEARLGFTDVVESDYGSGPPIDFIMYTREMGTLRRTDLARG